MELDFCKEELKWKGDHEDFADIYEQFTSDSNKIFTRFLNRVFVA